jgi:hypothetical protein
MHRVGVAERRTPFAELEWRLEQRLFFLGRCDLGRGAVEAVDTLALLAVVVAISCN